MATVYKVECGACGDSFISTDAESMRLWGEQHQKSCPGEPVKAGAS